jgi:predicted TIM-barrel fold metal-dependent hydrolase
MIEAPLVDTHAHIYTVGMPFVDNPRHRPDYDFTAEQYLAELDRHGVHFGVLAAASLYGTYNDYVVDSLKAYPRLRGTVIVDPTVERDALRRMKDAGVVGVRFCWISLATAPNIDSYEYRLLLRHIRDLDWHVHLQLGRGRLAAILPFVEQSGVKTVIDHLGYPDPKLGFACPDFQAVPRSIDTGRTWVKLSAGYRIGREAVDGYAKELLKVAGPERLLWGSDAPFASFESEVTYRQAIDDLADWVPDAAARRKITADTPLKLYFS